jgi:(2Fe-2S) ferredoxin
MGIKVRVKRMSCMGSCLNSPIVELRWSREERVYDVDDIDAEIEEHEQENERDESVDTAWSAGSSDSAFALKQITVAPGDEMYLESSTARLIDKTA